MKSGFPYLKSVAGVLPGKPGVYQMYDRNGRLLYIGKAKVLSKRVSSYTQESSLSRRMQKMVRDLVRLETIQTRDEAEALLLEATLIQKHRPPYNIVFRDNKTLPCLKLSVETWPRLVRVRALDVQRSTKRPKGEVIFGPFPSVREVALTQKALQRAFKLRTCSDHTFQSRTRPCLQFFIKRCTAPCVARITRAAYMKDVRALKQVLEGRFPLVQEALTQEMKRLSETRAYERAAQTRDRLHALLSVQQRAQLFLPMPYAAHVVGVHASSTTLCLYLLFFDGGQLLGGKEIVTVLADSEVSVEQSVWQLLAQFYQKNVLPRLLLTSLPPLLDSIFEKGVGAPRMCVRSPASPQEQEILDNAVRNAQECVDRYQRRVTQEAVLWQELATMLGCAQTIRRIEVYDNSHLFGKDAYGAMIVATEQGFESSQYRTFKLPPSFDAQNDYAAMTSVLERRFSGMVGADPSMIPDLIVIDGGKGHLHAVQKVLTAYPDYAARIFLLAVAKGPKRGRVQERFYTPAGEKKLEKGTPLYLYLERLRDEAHRFALGVHVQRRQKNFLREGFRDLPGVGALRARKLRDTFGTLAQLKAATEKQIASVEGIGGVQARKIYQHLAKYD